MNRREAIKSGILATGAILSTNFMGFRPLIDTINTGGYSTIKLDIGELETFIISDGIVSLDSVQPTFAPKVSKDTVNKELKRLHINESKFEASISVLLIKNAGKIMLLDTGAGNHMGENAGKLVGALKALNIEPTDITNIVITHAHLDHIGGIIDEQNNIVFPSAQYHIAEREHRFWMSEQDNSTNDAGVLFARKVLTKIKNRLNFFQYGDVLFSCLKTELADGHTRGHTIFSIFSGEKSIKHIVDTFHTPLLVAKPEWGTEWDADFDEAVKTRQRIIEEGANDRTLFMSCHLPWPSLGYIDKVKGTQQWTIFPYANPTKIVI